jgi:nicotinate phosphoribosyltransferase
MAGDVITLQDDPVPGEPLLHPVMREGKRTAPARPLTEIRQHARAQLDQLPVRLRALEQAHPYPVEISPALRALADEVDLAVSRAAAMPDSPG